MGMSLTSKLAKTQQKKLLQLLVVGRRSTRNWPGKGQMGQLRLCSRSCRDTSGKFGDTSDRSSILGNSRWVVDGADSNSDLSVKAKKRLAV
jgi:hypothetical protein